MVNSQLRQPDSSPVKRVMLRTTLTQVSAAMSSAVRGSSTRR